METVLEQSVLYFLCAVLPWAKVEGRVERKKKKRKKKPLVEFCLSVGKDFIIALQGPYLLSSFCMFVF